jgi:hypothetical protein
VITIDAGGALRICSGASSPESDAGHAMGWQVYVVRARLIELQILVTLEL